MNISKPNYRLIFYLLALLASCLPVCADDLSQMSNSKLLEAAEYENNHRHCERAVQLCNEMIRRNPANYRAFQIKAACLDYQVGPEEALKVLEPFVNKYPQNCMALSDFGEYYTSAGQYEKALAFFDRAIKIQPLNYNLYHLRSISLSSLKRYDRAAADLTSYLKLNPRHARGYEWRADAYKELGQFDKAIIDLTMAMKLAAQKGGEFRLQRADLYLKLKDYESALADYDVVLKQNPADDTVWFKKGQVLEILKDYNSAVAAFTEAINLSESSTAYYARAAVYEKLKNRAAALKDRAAGDKLARQRAIERI